MTTDKKNNISLATTILASVITVGTIFYHYVEKQTKTDAIYDNQVETNNTINEMKKSIKNINDDNIYLKTTLMDHIEAESKSRESMIASNNKLIEILSK